MYTPRLERMKTQVPDEARNARAALNVVIQQESEACDLMMRYVQFWKRQLRRRDFWLVKLEHTDPVKSTDPKISDKSDIKDNIKKIEAILLKRLVRLGGVLHQQRLTSRLLLDSKSSRVWSRNTWSKLGRVLGESNAAKIFCRYGDDENTPVSEEDIGQLRDARMQDLSTELGPAAAPFWWNWYYRKAFVFPYNIVAIPLFATALLVMLAKRKLVVRAASTAWSSLSDFFYSHIFEPCRAILGEVLFRRQVDRVDKAALAQSRDSLKKMLKSYYDETLPNLSAKKRSELASNMDMGPVSEQFSECANYAITNTIKGELPRLALIRMQFVEKEMLGLMDSVETLLDKNEINMQLSATMPAILVAYGAYQGATSLIYKIMGRKSDNKVTLNMRKEMLRLERLLTLKDFRGAVDSKLPDVDMGKTIVVIYRLRQQLESTRWRFDPFEVAAMATDLSELEGEYGPLTVRQQLMVVRRMRVSYSWLR